MVIGTSSAFREEMLRRYFSGAFENFVTIPPDVNEKEYRADDPVKMTEEIARAKMKAVLEKVKRLLPAEAAHGVVVTFDQVAVKDGEIREKPISKEENREFLASYSGSSVKTVSTYIVYSLDTTVMAVGHQETETFFSPFGNDVIDRIIERGASMNAAGGFVVEDPDLSQHVLRVSGTLDGVRGMDPALVGSLLVNVE
ncbi:MAF-like septum formation protein [Trypanosoma theileri]|uniref:MAF-like septum formation protein n=1 Tax=Trypanosoma theileri TaxID=67003 RepID=A0A1X0NW04_9TRYP|nr:MAF-like septum formation protein [Trypanosoma theileri]ORC88389.1 MAF-like septum formation protein [Trypanosoma theileri]